MRGEYAVGIDVGGTKIEGVLLDSKGVVHKRRRIPSEASAGPEALFQRIAWLVHKLTKRQGVPVGVSFPGHIDREGLLRDCPNLPGLEGKPLRQLLHRHIKHPLVVENDAKCFALAEYHLGAGEGKKHVVGLIVGTGIGAGVITNGKLVRGWNGGAGEVGHILYQGMDVERYAAGPGIVRRYYLHGGSKETAERIFEKRSMVAKTTVDETIESLGWLCTVLVKTYDPELIILGGGVSNAPILKGMNTYLKEHGMHTCTVVRNTLGDASGGLGAALLALRL